MKNLFKTRNPFRSVLLIAIIVFAASRSNGQQIKPMTVVTHLLTESKFIMKYMGRVRP